MIQDWNIKGACCYEKDSGSAKIGISRSGLLKINKLAKKLCDRCNPTENAIIMHIAGILAGTTYFSQIYTLGQSVHMCRWVFFPQKNIVQSKVLKMACSL